MRVKPKLVAFDDLQYDKQFAPIDSGLISVDDALEILHSFGKTLVNTLNEMSIDKLSPFMSLRPLNICKVNGIHTIQEFMKLTPQSFLRMKNAGTKSWEEVDHLQRQIRGERPWEHGFN